nr:immunoglobulin light chain junction region [Macaca mulatta]
DYYYAAWDASLSSPVF